VVTQNAAPLPDSPLPVASLVEQATDFAIDLKHHFVDRESLQKPTWFVEVQENRLAERHL